MRFGELPPGPMLTRRKFVEPSNRGCNDVVPNQGIIPIGVAINNACGPQRLANSREHETGDDTRRTLLTRRPGGPCGPCNRPVGL